MGNVDSDDACHMLADLYNRPKNGKTKTKTGGRGIHSDGVDACSAAYGCKCTVELQPEEGLSIEWKQEALADVEESSVCEQMWEPKGETQAQNKTEK